MAKASHGGDDLDVALRAFAAADAFERDAADLRAELRRLRAAGRAAPPWGRVDARLPQAVPRIAAEAAFLIAVAVLAGVAGLPAAAIVAAMAVAWLVVAAAERLASRERAAAPPAGADPYEQSLLEALRPSPSARTRSSSAPR